jgi:hypothetical protein
MSRRLFGGWGWELSDRQFGQALALLGVIAPGLATSAGLRAVHPRRQAHGKRPQDITAAHANSLLTQAMEASPAGLLTWDLSPLGGIDGLRPILDRLPVGALVRVWEKSFAGYRPLEIRPAPGLDDRWTFDILSGALEAGLPHFGLSAPPGRLRWNWPTRVGFQRDAAGLRDWVYGRLSQSVAPLTEPAVGPDRCDVLLVEAHGIRRLAEIVTTPLPEASLVILFESDWRPAALSRARAVAASANAWGVVVVRADSQALTEWFRTLIRELSHEESLLNALRTAGSVTGLFAAAGLVGAVPLRIAGSALASRMEQTLSMTATESPQAPPLPKPTMEVLALRPDRRVTMAVLGKRLRETNLAYASEGDGATDIAAVSRAAEPVLIALERRQVEDRYIRAAVEARRGQTSKPVRRGFRAGARHRIAVSIGPRDEDLVVATDVIPPEVLADAAGHRLTVVLSEPTLLARPVVRTLELPAFGASEAARFELPVRRSVSNVEARISLLHRGRILQTAVLRGPVFGARELARRESGKLVDDTPGIQIVPEANLRPGLGALDDRSRFHAAVVLNHDSRGRSGGTVIGRHKAAQLNFDFVKEAVATLSGTLERAERDAAFNRKLDSPASISYLRLLALHGRSLYTRIGSEIERTFPRRRLERLQVLSANPNTMLPVELIYDLPPPRAKPKLCGNAAAALETGRCDPHQFHVEDEEGQLDVVCPSGFWGISKIIERQATDQSGPRAGFKVRSMPDRRQSTLGPLTPVLFAASEHVNDVDPKELDRVGKALKKLTNKRVTRVDRWLDWARDVKNDEPPLLLLLSHTELGVPEGPSLEIAKIGGPELRAVAAITRNYVNLNPDRPGPVVMLLGCTTAVPLEHFQSFVVQFADMGASVVVGTIAPVLGRHAGRTAEALIEQLNGIQAESAGRRRATPVGEALRDIRRRLLAKGIIMSMSLAAYGDADWRIPAEA